MDDVEALSTIVAVLKQLDPDVQRRVLQSAQTFLGHAALRDGPSAAPGHVRGTASFGPSPTDFSRDRTLSAKEFLREKHPVTDADRVACLAYYLAHYRDTPHFKTIDISTLNTEAAQPKFSNASVAVDNATRDGYLAPAAKGNKQISAAGEKYVELLPDRGAAREAIRNYRKRRFNKKSRKLLAK
jgi:hypothetical protein